MCLAQLLAQHVGRLNCLGSTRVSVLVADEASNCSNPNHPAGVMQLVWKCKRLLGSLISVLVWCKFLQLEWSVIMESEKNPNKPKDKNTRNKQAKEKTRTQETNKQKKKSPKKCILNPQSYVYAQVTPVTLQSCPYVQRAGPQVTSPTLSGTTQSVAGPCSTLYWNLTLAVPVKCIKARVTPEHY